MRNLVTIRRVASITPIPDADAIETVRVDGWDVVCKKGDFVVGEYAVFFEIDSFVPHEIAPFLTKVGHHPKDFEGTLGQRLRTVRLRKQLSQGLLLPLSVLEDRDLRDVLGVKLWEPVLAPHLRGFANGNFPHYIRKTDQERIQNSLKVFKQLDKLYEVSLKLDGSSCTVYYKDDHAGICSRNFDLKITEENSTNAYVSTATTMGFIDLVSNVYADEGRNIAVQAELMGPGIQGNRENLTETRLFIFDIWDIDNQCYMSRNDRIDLLTRYGFIQYHIPTFLEPISLQDLGTTTLKSLLAFVDSSSHPLLFSVSSPIEGLVFKAIDGTSSFKVISNKFLERER